MKAAQPAVLPLFDCMNLPISQIGERGVRLTSLLKHGIALPAALIIPAQSFNEILAEEKLASKWVSELAQLDWQNPTLVAQASHKIQRQIAHLQISRHFATDLLNQYQKWLDDEYVAVRPSFVLEHASVSGWSQLNVRGEANLWQSILQIWQRAYQPEYLQTRWYELQHGVATPMAFLLQRMIPAVSSGWMQLAASSNTNLPILEVYSQWGITPTQKVPKPQLDVFQVDLQTRTIRQQQLGTKISRAESQLDRINYQSVEAHLQTQSSLASVHLSHLAKLYQTIWYQNINPPLVEWAVADDSVMILDATAAVEPLVGSSPKVEVQPLPAKHTSLASPIQISYLGKSSKATQGSLQIAKAHTLAKQLKFSLTDSRQPAKQAWWHDRLVQHLQLLHKNVTLLYATDIPNHAHPSYRGGIQLLHNPNLLDAEIDALASIAYAQPHSHLGIVIPFVRSISEWGMIERHLRHKTTEHQFTPEVWLELAVPANFAELQGYLRYRPDGVIIHWPSLSQLSRGLDLADSEVAPFYAAEDSLLESEVQPAVKLLHEHTIPVILLVERASSAQLTLFQEWGISAVVLDPDWQGMRNT